MIFIAEIGMNYEGNMDFAYEMIKQAKLSGADIAKFQFGWRNKPGEINFIDLKSALQLKDWCDYWEIELLASIITEESLELAHDVGLNRYKIASRTVIDNPALCEKIISEGKETLISLGMWEKDDFPFGNPEGTNIKYLFCCSKYPNYPVDLIPMPKIFTPNTYYGYSDHLHGIEGCLLAISRGAQLIEKHFTLNKASQTIRDHTLSALPSEFKQLTELGGTMARLNNIISNSKYI